MPACRPLPAPRPRAAQTTMCDADLIGYQRQMVVQRLKNNRTDIHVGDWSTTYFRWGGGEVRATWGGRCWHPSMRAGSRGVGVRRDAYEATRLEGGAWVGGKWHCAGRCRTWRGDSVHGRARAFLPCLLPCSCVCCPVVLKTLNPDMKVRARAPAGVWHAAGACGALCARMPWRSDMRRGRYESYGASRCRAGGPPVSRSRHTRIVHLKSILDNTNHGVRAAPSSNSRRPGAMVGSDTTCITCLRRS